MLPLTLFLSMFCNVVVAVGQDSCKALLHPAHRMTRSMLMESILNFNPFQNPLHRKILSFGWRLPKRSLRSPNARKSLVPNATRHSGVGPTTSRGAHDMPARSHLPTLCSFAYVWPSRRLPAFVWVVLTRMLAHFCGVLLETLSWVAGFMTNWVFQLLENLDAS